MPLGHHEYAGVVRPAVFREIQCHVPDAAGQSFAVLRIAADHQSVGLDKLELRAVPAMGIGRNIDHEILHPLTAHGLAIQVKTPTLHLDAVAGQPDDTLDVVRALVQRAFEHHHVTAHYLAFHDAAIKQIQRKRQRMSAVTVGIF